MLMITISVITSALTAKIVATYYFKKVDGYVRSIQHTCLDRELSVLQKVVLMYLLKQIVIQRRMVARMS